MDLRPEQDHTGCKDPGLVPDGNQEDSFGPLVAMHWIFVNKNNVVIYIYTHTGIYPERLNDHLRC